MEPTTDGILIDSGIVIGYIRRRSEVKAALERALIKHDRVCISATVYEVEFGAERAGRHSDLDQITLVLSVLPFDEHRARRAAQLASDLITRNQAIGLPDVIIAATALQHRLPLLTTNAVDFQRVPDLLTLTPQDFVSS